MQPSGSGHHLLKATIHCIPRLVHTLQIQIEIFKLTRWKSDLDLDIDRAIWDSLGHAAKELYRLRELDFVLGTGIAGKVREGRIEQRHVDGAQCLLVLVANAVEESI